MKKNSDKNSSSYIISKLMLNSLYGRFGMSPYLDKHTIIDSCDLVKFSNDNEITSILPLSDDKELVSFQNNSFIDNEGSSTLCNIAIAAAVTAGARVFMSYFKNMDGYKLYYSDTDSIDIDKPLPEEFVGQELGQFKLEHVFDEAVYLAPKMYGGKTADYEYVRIKGLKNPIPFDELLKLLQKGNSLVKDNQKWYKKIGEGHIFIKNEIYTLSITDSKRQLLFDQNNKFYDTKPIKL